MFFAVSPLSMRVFGLLCLWMFCTVNGHSTQFADVIGDVSLCFKAGDTKQLSQYFSSSMNITFRQEEGVYSRVQSEIILKEFFNRNQPKEVKLVHRIDSNPNFRYVVLRLSTANGSYRVSFKMAFEGNKFKMTELRIE